MPDDGKDMAAQAMGRRGGAARAGSMTPERRAAIARAAARNGGATNNPEGVASPAAMVVDMRSLDDVLARIDAAQVAKPRGPYKKRSAWFPN